MKMKMADQPVLSLNDVREVLKQYRKQKAKPSLRDAAGRELARREFKRILKHKLENAIPKGNKYRVLRRMARLFDEEGNIKNYKLVQCFIPTIGVNGRRRKFSEHDYKDRKSFYDDDEKIKNHFKGLKKYWETLGYTVKFGKYSSRVALTKTLGKK